MKEEHNALYQHELNVLSRGRHELKRPDMSSDGIRAEYERLMHEYEKLVKWSKKIAAISDVQAKMLRRRESDLMSLLDHTNQGFLTFGANLRVNPQFSKACIRIFGRNISGANIVELLFSRNADKDRNIVQQLFEQPMNANISMEEAQVQLAELPDRAVIRENQVTLEYRPIIDEITGERLLLLIVTDISERMASEERIQYLSEHDVLTSLYNRSYLEPHLEQPPKPGWLPVSLLVIDMNGLKLANDMFGHREGDKLLARGAELLRHTFGEDEATLARWGGDEFVVILPRADHAACAAAADRLKAACERSAIDPVKISMAIGVATLTNSDEPLMTAFVAADKMMYKNKLLENNSVRADMMKSVTSALIARGVERSGHRQRLSKLALDFAKRLGLQSGSHDLHLLELLIPMHDVGYLALPSDLLLKAGSLTEEEWELVRSHSEIGYRMASSIGEWALAEAIRGMHERWDGSGYPYGLSGEQIPFVSRLLAIADAYDVMTHDQVYKPAVSPSEALREIEAQAGRQFDPQLAAAWLEFVRESEAVMKDSLRT